MTYLLDTDVCIAVINGRPPAVGEHMARIVGDGATIFVSAVSLFELSFGVAKSASAEKNAERLEVFLAACEVLPFDSDDARVAGVLRAYLNRNGTPIGAYDTLIAAQAIRGDLILVTGNVREFSRAPDLRWENWIAP
ncbi:MAG: type II toxin-antitoxin system VapC family toxin [Alphaproteobacteria bacterium]|nr:type II toxin-antitoxin system VapC family toxin [Alphaproteobacteria bacterium]